MDPLYTPPAVTKFLAVICDGGADVATQTVLRRSLRAWAPSYHYLRTTFGEHHPLPLEMPRHSSRVTQTALAAAHAILAGVADTFRCFFRLPWARLDISHTHLIATFPRLCAAHRLTGDTDDLYARMRALQTRLSAYPHAYRSPPSAVAPSPETLCELVTDLEQYIIGMLDFFARNIPHSILGTNTYTRNARTPQDGMRRLGVLSGQVLPADGVTSSMQRHAG